MATPYGWFPYTVRRLWRTPVRELGTRGGRMRVGWLGVTLGRPLRGAQMRVLRKPICELAQNV